MPTEKHISARDRENKPNECSCIQVRDDAVELVVGQALLMGNRWGSLH